MIAGRSIASHWRHDHLETSEFEAIIDAWEDAEEAYIMMGYVPLNEHDFHDDNDSIRKKLCVVRFVNEVPIPWATLFRSHYYNVVKPYDENIFEAMYDRRENSTHDEPCPPTSRSRK